MTAFVVVTFAEMGDKTQLIAFSLASRYRRPWTVMAGIFVATVANHGLASALGVWGASRLSEPVLPGEGPRDDGEGDTLRVPSRWAHDACGHKVRTA